MHDVHLIARAINCIRPGGFVKDAFPELFVEGQAEAKAIDSSFVFVCLGNGRWCLPSKAFIGA